MVTKQIEWRIDEILSGMEKKMQPTSTTTDGCGHLFVADWEKGNKCIQMFSVSDGTYLGFLIRDVEVLGAPGIIKWSERTSSLLSAYYLRKKWYFKVIKVEYSF